HQLDDQGAETGDEDDDVRFDDLFLHVKTSLFDSVGIILKFIPVEFKRIYLESVYKCTFPVMPDLIRHPEGLERTGFRLSPE
ncbi:MAG: hypothetical protein QME83_18755, partial [Thermodesulfobacteriota bacterium]|nr:hypothetical protein [Thermodesulfobacteriota bacterium]